MFLAMWQIEVQYLVSLLTMFGLQQFILLLFGLEIRLMRVIRLNQTILMQLLNLNKELKKA